jgi:AcrR family transcriptional regulator
MSRVTFEHTEARRRSILEAAHKVFARKGIQSATMAEIAEEAGLSAGVIYRYFESKEALAMSCFKQTGEQLTAEWRQMAESSTDPMAIFREIARRSFDEIKAPDAADHTRMMLEHLLDTTRSDDPQIQAAARAERQTIVAGLEWALQRAQDAGQLSPLPKCHDLAQALCSFYMGARMARLLDPSLDTDHQLAALSTLLDPAEDQPARPRSAPTPK